MDRIRRMFETHPAPASDAGDEAFALVSAAAECLYTCTTCADACLEEDDPAALRKCIRTNHDCADVCGATARIVSRPGEQDSELIRAQLDSCATACRACATECERHAEAMEHCRICTEACRACADACEAMNRVVVP